MCGGRKKMFAVYLFLRPSNISRSGKMSIKRLRYTMSRRKTGPHFIHSSRRFFHFFFAQTGKSSARQFRIASFFCRSQVRPQRPRRGPVREPRDAQPPPRPLRPPALHDPRDGPHQLRAQKVAQLRKCEGRGRDVARLRPTQSHR